MTGFPSRSSATSQIQALYRLLGDPDRFCSFTFNGDHAHNAHAAREVQAWFYRWLWPDGGL